VQTFTSKEEVLCPAKSVEGHRVWKESSQGDSGSKIDKINMKIQSIIFVYIPGTGV
jgi:hypothetical protein